MSSNLLLVDDEPNVPRAIRRALRSEGYKFLIANSAAEAFDLLRATPVDVVISDHRMPGVTGSEFLSEVNNRYPDTVRLMLSGQADIEAVIDAINEGSIFKFVAKPWKNDQLKQVVREASNRAQAQQVDEHTGWQTHKLFKTRLSALLEDQPARIVVGEIRNLATAWALLSKDQRRALADKIAQRCAAALGEPVIELASLDRGLFALALDISEGDDLINGLVERLSAPMVIDDQALRLHIAAGYVDSTAVGDSTPGALIRKAIVALTNADIEGTGYAGYRPNSMTSLKLRQSLEHDLSSALARSQFFLQLQPQVDSGNLRIRSAEALIRWQHPVHGLISPAQFIDMAERNGFINDIGVWVICSTMQQLETLAELGMGDVRLSFNLSPRQLTDGGTASWLTVLRQYAIEEPELMNQLELEVTESTVMDCSESATRALEEAKELGIRIALDDFGTGHSSLAQLNALPLDVLKLDRSLIQDIEINERSMTLLKHLASMAKDLGLEVIAEGVETQSQVQVCKDLHCDLIQGYAFYKPLDVEDFYRVLRSERHGQH